MSNPYLPEWEYIPDGEPHIFGDRIYVYGSHDRFGGIKFCLEDYVCWSASVDNPRQWRYEGVIYKKTQHPGNEKGRRVMWAPDVAQGPDGRYYLYYSLENDVEMGVAVCGEPAGKYEFLGLVSRKDGTAWGRKKGDKMPFDPGIIVDGGRIFLYAGQGPAGGFDMLFAKNKKYSAFVTELEEDMVTMKTEPKELIPSLYDSKGTDFEGHEFFEANSIRKFGDKYYFIYSSVLSHELVYAVSDKPDGGFRFGGILTSSADIGLNGNTKPLYYYGNNHGSVANIKGRYYIFGHRHTNRSMFSRQDYADPIEMDENGHFIQAPRTSSGFDAPAEGFRACKASHLYAKGGACFSFEPVQTFVHPCITQCGRGETAYQYISGMRDGATAGFRYVDLSKTDRLEISLRVSGEGELVLVDLDANRELSRVRLSRCKKWTVFTAEIDCKKEKVWLGFIYEGKGKIDFLEFNKAN